MLKQDRRVRWEAAWATVLACPVIKTLRQSSRQQTNMEAAELEEASSPSRATSKTPACLTVAVSRTWVFSSKTIHSCIRWTINSCPPSKAIRACILPLKRIIQPQTLPALWLALQDICHQATTHITKLCRQPLPPMVLSHNRPRSMEDSQQANKVQAILQQASMESHLSRRPKDISGRVLPSTSRSRSSRRSSSISFRPAAKALEAKPLPKPILTRYAAYTLDSKSSWRTWSSSTPCSPGSRNCCNMRSPSYSQSLIHSWSLWWSTCIIATMSMAMDSSRWTIRAR